MSHRFIKFVTTDQECTISGNSYPGIPIFFSENGVMECVSEYMIHLRYEQRKPAGTTETYAYHLQKFLKHIRNKRVEWSSVTDGTLIAWRDHLLDVDGLEASTVAAYLGSVFSFYQWAEENGRLKYGVAIYTPCRDQACSCQKRTYQISASENKNGRDYIWPYIPKNTQKPNRHTPVSEELELVHVAAFENSTGTRDSLLLSFYEELCTRRSETLNLKLIDIPSWDEIDDATEKNSVFTLKVLGKGNKYRYVPALPELMARTREYIEGDRALAIKSAKRRNSAFLPPEDVIVGRTTGKPLTKQYVSRRISELMRSVGIANAAGHRVRATGLTALVEAYDGVDQSGKPLPPEQVLWKVADRAGHTNWASLRPYLNLARSPGHDSDIERSLRSSTRLHMLQRQIAELTSDLGDIEKVRSIVTAIGSGRISEAKALLRTLDKESSQLKKLRQSF